MMLDFWQGFGVQGNERAVVLARSSYDLSCSETFVLYTPLFNP